jgi:class 3 adenylate cyclase
MTLLFTDIEGSTQHWEERGDAMPDALRRHDRLLRTAIEANGGHVFKAMGDGFCAGGMMHAHRPGAATIDYGVTVKTVPQPLWPNLVQPLVEPPCCVVL